MPASLQKSPVVLVAGHICLDLHPTLAELPVLDPGHLVEVGPLELAPGGCVANTGGDLVALGVPVSVAADVGEDILGRILADLLRERGLDAAGLSRRSSTTSYSVVVQAPGVDRIFWHHVGANCDFDGQDLSFGTERVLHVGYPSLLPALVARDGAPLRDLLVRARANGLATSVDFAVVDAPTPASRSRWAAILATCLPLMDVLTPSIDDLDSMTGLTDEAGDPLAAARELVRGGAAIALVTAGQRGVALATADSDRFARAGEVVASLGTDWHSCAVRMSPVAVASFVTTTGAGDAATAGFLAALLARCTPEAAMQRAVAAAAAKIAGSALAPLPAGPPAGPTAGLADPPG
jgi:sugar/nucleoside kinase (ribokinase family)